MSSTNRGGKRSEADFYPTPAAVTRAFLDEYPLPRGGLWLEPAVGDGAIIRAVRDRLPAGHWHACDIRAECRDQVADLEGVEFSEADFLAGGPSLRNNYAVSITNPPFSLAMPFIEKMIQVSDFAVLLLRLNFLETVKRSEFFRHRMPDVLVLPKRPSFTGDGKTDSIAYAWFVWPPGRNGKIGYVSVLAP